MVQISSSDQLIVNYIFIVEYRKHFWWAKLTLIKASRNNCWAWLFQLDKKEVNSGLGNQTQDAPISNVKQCIIKEMPYFGLIGEKLVSFSSQITTLQSLKGKYRGLQGNPCNENMDPVMRTGVTSNKNRVFPVGIELQGVPCKPYRVWVCSNKQNRNLCRPTFLTLLHTRNCTSFCMSFHCKLAFLSTETG